MKYFFLFALLLLFQTSIPAQKTALLAKTLINGTGKIISNPAVIIDSNKIILVTTKENIPKDAKSLTLVIILYCPG